eukprot:626765-Prymnesium_polylepis.1
MVARARRVPGRNDLTAQDAAFVFVCRAVCDHAGARLEGVGGAHDVRRAEHGRRAADARLQERRLVQLVRRRHAAGGLLQAARVVRAVRDGVR